MTPLTDVNPEPSIDIFTYADDMQLILSLSDKIFSTRNNFNTCMIEVATWMKSNCLKLNKTRPKW